MHVYVSFPNIDIVRGIVQIIVDFWLQKNNSKFDLCAWFFFYFYFRMYISLYV